MKKINKKLVSALVLWIIATPALFAVALYNPGDALDPTCAPGATDRTAKLLTWPTGLQWNIWLTWATWLTGATWSTTTASSWYVYTAYADVNLSNKKIKWLASPTSWTDGVNKDYVDAAVAGAGGWGGAVLSAITWLGIAYEIDSPEGHALLYADDTKPYPSWYDGFSSMSIRSLYLLSYVMSRTLHNNADSYIADSSIWSQYTANSKSTMIISNWSVHMCIDAYGSCSTAACHQPFGATWLLSRHMLCIQEKLHMDV